jgi:hypothetical protein
MKINTVKAETLKSRWKIAFQRGARQDGRTHGQKKNALAVPENVLVITRVMGEMNKTFFRWCRQLFHGHDLPAFGIKSCRWELC